MKDESKCLHSGYTPVNGGPRVMPIYQSTTFRYNSTEEIAEVFDDPTKSHIYSRFTNPTVDAVEKKTLDYLDTLDDSMLYECPENCRFTRMELVLRQYRHLSFHTGMLNGQVAVNTGKFPMWVSDADKYIDDGVFFGRYRQGQTKI